MRQRGPFCVPIRGPDSMLIDNMLAGRGYRAVWRPYSAHHTTGRVREWADGEQARVRPRRGSAIGCPSRCIAESNQDAMAFGIPAHPCAAEERHRPSANLPALRLCRNRDRRMFDGWSEARHGPPVRLCLESGGNSPTTSSERVELRLIKRRGQGSWARSACRGFAIHRPCAW
jgi:hypothetical protein